MKLSDLFLSQLELEADHTRRVLESFPEGKDTWKPHPKSMELGYLANFLASMPLWVEMGIKLDELDLHSATAQSYKAKQLRTAQELVQEHDKNVERARAALQGIEDEHFDKPWRLLVAGKVVQDTSRRTMIQDTVFSHLSHHRGQMTVYLRLNEKTVPAIFGPSADEKEF